MEEFGAEPAGDDYDPATLLIREQAEEGVVQLSTRHLRGLRPDIPKGKLETAVKAFESPAGHNSIRYKKPGEKSRGALASASHNVDAAAILSGRLGYAVEVWIVH